VLFLRRGIRQLTSGDQMKMWRKMPAAQFGAGAFGECVDALRGLSGVVAGQVDLLGQQSRHCPGSGFCGYTLGGVHCIDVALDPCCAAARSGQWLRL